MKEAASVLANVKLQRGGMGEPRRTKCGHLMIKAPTKESLPGRHCRPETQQIKPILFGKLAVDSRLAVAEN
ncbi:hypothetical protein TM49_05600 [Martelella endophytica]|uniref:Uncharacterized protein n=1 Tax=Martelella endophytica TaxID=1486262 RepID=A0A0D5LMV6_MAREN|nr:hypothetical protein TM49_05600 [Martelella endophytica]